MFKRFKTSNIGQVRLGLEVFSRNKVTLFYVIFVVIDLFIVIFFRLFYLYSIHDKTCYFLKIY